MARLHAWMLGCAVLAGVHTSHLAAQDTIGAPEAQAAADGEIVVKGYTEKEVRDFLWRALETDGRVMTRRTDPICVGIDNAPSALAEAIKARIEANLTAFDIPLGEPGCKANAVVVFHSRAHAFVNMLEKQGSGAAFWSMYLPQKRRLIKPVRQAYAWHFLPEKARRLDASRNQPAAGRQPGEVAIQQPAGFEPGGRILSNQQPSISSHSFAVIDTDAIDGLTIEQVGDWLTMRMLVDVRPETGERVPADSILNLFTPTGSNPDAPAGLSRLDRALLTQLYGRRWDYRVGAVRASAARAAVSELKEDGYLREEGQP